MGNIEQDPVAPVILGVTGIVFFAIVGRAFALRFRQPSVLGELAMGVLLGNVGYLVGIDLLIVLREGPVILELVNAALNDGSVSDAVNARFGARAGEVLEGCAAPD